jgi:putative transposase
MRGPNPPSIKLSEAERQALEALTRRHSTPQQLAFRARIVLACADGLNNAQVGRQLDTNVNTVRHWRTRWLGLQAVSLDDLSVAERLEDAPRPGAPPRITAEQVCQIVALACDAPEKAGRPISQWTGREMADEIIKRGIIETISERHAARLLKRGT